MIVMVIMVVILLTMLFMLGALVFTTGSSMVLDNGSYYLGITIPKNYRNEEAVKVIVAQYKKSWRVISLIGLVTCFMVLFFYDYVSIQMVYIMVWFFALMYVYQQNLKKYGWKLYNWKNWQGCWKRLVFLLLMTILQKGKARIRRLSAICFPAVIILRQTDGYTSGSVK